jgi:hypothetical protein
MNKKIYTVRLLSLGLVASAFMGCLNSTESSSNSTDASGFRISGITADVGAGVTKVDVCHIPPGNPENAHTITVGSPAVAAHLAHGDAIGACQIITTPPEVIVTPPIDTIFY